MPILAILFTRQGGRPTKHKRVISRDARGLVPRIQGVRSTGCKVMIFASEPGGIMEVAARLCLPLLLGL